MQMSLPTPPTHAPIRTSPSTRGRELKSIAPSCCSDPLPSVAPVMSGTTSDKFRIVPFASSTPGFSRPCTPYRSSFIRSLRPLRSQRPASIDDVNLPRRKARFIRGQIHRQRCDLFGTPEPTHRLSRYELRMRLLIISLRRDPLFQRRRLHRAWADGIAPDPLM